MKKGKKILICILIIAVIVGVVFGLIKLNSTKKYNVKLEEISLKDVKYFLLEQNQMYGVIDADGNVVIEPKYQSIQIPNPTKDVFITYESEDADGKAVNSKGESILSDYESVEAIDISQLSSTVPYEKTVLKYKENGSYGLIDFDGKKITDAIYEEIQGLDYKEGFVKVKQNGLYGVINIRNEEVIPIEYDNVSTDGYYDEDTEYKKAGFVLRTKTDDGYKYSYVSYDGKIKLDSTYSSLERLTDVDDDKNIYLISSINGKYGLIKNNKQVIENDYIELEYDKESNLLVLNKGTASGVANLDGKMIIPVDYDSILIGGQYINAYKEDTRLVFNLEGNQVETNYTNYVKANDDYAIVIDASNNYNIVGKDGKEKLTDQYVYLEYFTNNLFIATKGNRTGLISADGKVVIPMQYSTMQKIELAKSENAKDKTAILQATDGDTKRVDIINQDGKISKGIADAILEKEEGEDGIEYLVMTSENNRKYFNYNGEEVSYKDIKGDNKLYAVAQNGKWGFADANGSMVIKPQYDFVTEFNKGFAGIKQNGKWGVINESGNLVLEPKYELEQRNLKFLGSYYEVNMGLGVPAYSGD
jgi:hypothetical protein